MFLLDSDHLVLLQNNAQPESSFLAKRMSGFKKSDFFLPIVSFHEQILGANVYISRAKNQVAVVRGYQLMEQALIDFNSFQVLQFDEPAAWEYLRQRKMKIRIGTMDLRIAAIAISHNLMLLSRNTSDFSQVLDLKCEDWTSS